MRVPLEDSVMRGYLISLGFQKVKSSQDTEMPLQHKEIMADEMVIMGYMTVRYEYEPNKRKIGLARLVTDPVVESFIFSKRGAEAGLTYLTGSGIKERAAMDPHHNLPRFVPHSDQEELLALMDRELARLPESARIQQLLGVVYQQLLNYTHLAIQNAHSPRM